jgi:hypothetical protein
MDSRESDKAIVSGGIKYSSINASQFMAALWIFWRSGANRVWPDSSACSWSISL